MVFQKVEYDKAVRMFEVYCGAKGLAQRTQETYASALSQLRGHLNEEDRAIPLQQGMISGGSQGICCDGVSQDQQSASA